MNAQQGNNNPVNEQKNRRHSGGSTLGVILIVVGLYWILKETGWIINLPAWGFVRSVFADVSDFMHVHLGELLWPVLLLITGLLLISGRRRIGGLIVLIALLIFLPGIIFPGILLVIFFPLVLIIAGILVIRSIL